MKIKTEREDVLKEYTAALEYKSGIELFERVQQNEDFYIGEQWKGVQAPDLDKPVFNILRRVINYFISSIVSDDISVRITEFNETDPNNKMLEMVSAQFSEIMEIASIKPMFRDALRDAAVDGDTCIHYYFDTENNPTGSITKGSIQAELIENTAVMFGNPQSGEVQKQPYILISYRKAVEDVQENAKANAIENWEEIKADDSNNGVNADKESGKVTVIRKYWKEKGEVMMLELTAFALVRPITKTGYSRYPLEYMCWEKVKNQCHGQAAVTGLIPNQIFINKLFAMAMQHVKMMAFPKVIYNKTLFPTGFTNRVGEAIGAIGDPNIAIASNFNPPDMSSQVLIMIDKVISYTRDTMGASDAALGNVKPDNTSAIIATQKATSMPLELQKMEFYRFVEGSVRIWLDMMAQNYGVRNITTTRINEITNTEERTTEAFDFETLKGLNLKLNVDIGASTYWSELMQVQTMDNLYSRKIISDPITYLESIPAAYIHNKQGIIDAIKKEKQEAQAAALLQILQDNMSLGVAM